MKRWRTLRFEFSAMASVCSMQIDGTDERFMRKTADAAIAEVLRIEHKYSRFRDDSIISRINRAAGLAPVTIDDETAGLLDFGDQLWQLSDGMFDMTSGVLRQAWNFKTGGIPEPALLASLLERVGWQKLERHGRQVRLTLPGMELDVGGFGKEYAADRAAAVLQKAGVVHALVNLGGDLHALGRRGLPECDDAPWHVAIQHPRPPLLHLHATLASLPVARGGLATSGDYERFFIHQGQRYCHILDPRTGWPVSYWQSVSVLAANTTTAGALATIAMLKGSAGEAWLQLQDVQYLAVRPDGQPTGLQFTQAPELHC